MKLGPCFFGAFSLARISIGVSVSGIHHGELDQHQFLHVSSKTSSVTFTIPRAREGLVLKRSIDDDQELRRKKELKSDALNVKKRQDWQERMARIKEGTASEQDMRIMQRIRDYDRGYTRDMRAQERHRLETGVMTFEELERILERRKRESKKREAKKQRLAQGTASQKEMDQRERSRAYQREYEREKRADKKARKAAGQLTQEELEQEARAQQERAEKKARKAAAQRTDEAMERRALAEADRRERDRKRSREYKRKQRAAIKAKKKAGTLSEQEMAQEERNRRKRMNATNEIGKRRRAERKARKAAGQQTPEDLEFEEKERVRSREKKRKKRARQREAEGSSSQGAPGGTQPEDAESQDDAEGSAERPSDGTTESGGDRKNSITTPKHRPQLPGGLNTAPDVFNLRSAFSVPGTQHWWNKVRGAAQGAVTGVATGAAVLTASIGHVMSISGGDWAPAKAP